MDPISIIKQINKQIPIEEVIQKEAGVSTYPGEQVHCFFHEDDTPSMTVYGGSEGCNCFGECGRSWFAYQFVKDWNKFDSFWETVEYIKKNYKVSIDDSMVVEKDLDDKYVADSLNSIKVKGYNGLRGVEIALSRYYNNDDSSQLEKVKSKLKKD